MQKQPRRVGVIFDVDGTLVDSNYLHTLAWFRAFRDHDLQVEMYRIHRSIGMGSDQLLDTLVGRYDKALTEGHSEHMKSLRSDQVAFPRAGDLLREVARRGAVVAWATSAKPEEIEHLRDVVGAREAVSHVTGSQDVEESKPSPDLFQVTLEACGLQPSDAIVVGDSRWDVEAAKRSHLRCVGVLTGGTSEAELKDSGAVAVYTDVRELLEKLDESPLAELMRAGAAD